MSGDCPNILVITTDQQHADGIGALGRTDVQTPHVDRLARHGVAFERCYCVAPECVPSRISFLTGQYPHTHGVYNGNKAVIPEEVISLPHALEDRLGYRTAVTGKRHFGQWQRPAFQHDTGDGLPGYKTYLERAGLLETYQCEFNAHRAAFLSYDTDISYEHSEPMWTGSATIDMIDRLGDGDAPFFICANFDNPHPPIRVPRDAPVCYDADALDLSQVQRNTAEDRWLLRQRPAGTRLGGENIWSAKVHGEDVYRHALARYYGMISMVDDNVGRIMRHLESCNLIDNTIVVFTSDHGDFAGEFGLLGKNPRGHFEALMRVPMIWYWRGHFGVERVHSLVQNIDLFPTICDMVGSDIPHTVQGTSFADTLRYSANGAGPGPVTQEVAYCDSLYCKTVMTRRFRLSLHYDGTEYGELFDRQADPYERINLFNDTAHTAVQEQMIRELVKWWIRSDQPRSWGVFESLNPGAAFRYHNQHPSVAERRVSNLDRINESESWN